MLSVPLDEAVIDYHVLSADTDEGGSTTRRILLVVAYRESIDRYLEATDAAKLELAGIDLEAFALLRAVAEPRAPRSTRRGGARRRQRSATTGRRSRSRTGASASSPACSSGAGAKLDIRARARAEGHADRGRGVKQSLSLERGRERVAGLPEQPLGRSGRRGALRAAGARRGSCSPRCASTRPSPGRCPCRRSSSPAARRRSRRLRRGARTRARAARLRRRPASCASSLAEGVDRPRDTHALAIAVGLGIED